MSDDFAGKRALVTGCASGIGLEVAHQLSSRGASVIGVDLHQGDFDDLGPFVSADVSVAIRTILLIFFFILVVVALTTVDVCVFCLCITRLEFVRHYHVPIARRLCVGISLSL